MECANGGNLEEYIERPSESFPAADGSSTATADDDADGTETKESESKKHLTARERLQSKRQRLQGSLLSPTTPHGEANGGIGSPTDQDEATAPRRHLSITEIWSFFFDICEGLAHLHRLGIIHRDLKPPNLLLSYSNSQIKGSTGERPRILITDFGECEILEQTAKRDRTGATGTLEFLAPELLAVDADGRYTDDFSFKGDMWSLGMVLYYLCYSRLPYSQIEDVDLLRTEIRAFKSIQIPEDSPDGRIVPEELKILIRVLLSPEKSKRPSCDEILTKLSHQRERMMHGEIDMQPTPIRAEDDNDYGISDRPDGNEGSVTTKDMTSTSGPSGLVQRRLLTAKVDHDLQLHRQHYHPVTQRIPGAATIASSSGPSGRRPSQTNLVTSDIPKATTPSSMARTMASPSVNLHRRVKPLGLGLRYMLRRRMMHPSSAGGYAHRYPRSSDGGQAIPGTGQGIFSVASFQSAIKKSQAAPTLASTSLSNAIVKASSRADMDIDTDLHMQRQRDFLKRKQPASVNSMDSSPAVSSPLAGSVMDIDSPPPNIQSATTASSSTAAAPAEAVAHVGGLSLGGMRPHDFSSLI
ncbi:hypothetical protein BGZ98_002424 [Dissophora globulifera]|nr:hypothetical protein BGZ98_002424 [Dissophora globulifera]